MYNLLTSPVFMGFRFFPMIYCHIQLFNFYAITHIISYKTHNIYRWYFWVKVMWIFNKYFKIFTSKEHLELFYVKNSEK